MEYEVVKSLLVAEKYGTWVELKPGLKVRITIEDWYLETIQEELDEYSGHANTNIIEGVLLNVDLPYDEVHISIGNKKNSRIKIDPYIVDCLEMLS